MLPNFKAISLSHKNACLSIRELISLNEQECVSLLHKIREVTEVPELMVLSTCNRTEVYYNSEQDLSETLIKLLGIERGIEDIETITPYFQRITDHREAVEHLFYVSIGLESQVAGDLQITNQVKRAYQWTADAGLAGPFLHRLMHTIFFTNKRVVQETAFRDGAASISYATAELVQELVHGKNDPKLLVVGLGEIGADVVRNLHHTEIKDISITNRTSEKAQSLAEECGYKAISFEETWGEVEKSDVIISAVSGKTPFFSQKQIQSLDRSSYKIFIDLSVPRSVEKSVEDLAGVIVHNIDDINSRATLALEKRKKSIPAVKLIIHESIEELEKWSKEMIFSPTIHKLKQALEEIRKEEIARFMKQLDDQEVEKIDRITKGIMNKIIKMPVLQLKAACKRGEAENLAEVITDLFDLEKNSKKIE